MEIPIESQIRYIVRRHQEWTIAEQAIAARDLASIEAIAHKWKGNGATFGFPELGKLGESLENAASQKRFDDVLALVNQFKSWLSSHPVPH